MNMKQLRKKHNRYRCLKTISYLLGFPLFILLVLIGSMCLFSGEAYTDVKWYGVIACVALWLVSVVVQIVISLITKNYNARTAFMLIVSVLLVIGGSVLCDLVVSKKYDEVAKEYAQYGVELDTYKHDAGWITTWTGGKKSVVKEYAENVDDFLRIYNIEYKSSNFGTYNANKGDDIDNYKAENDGSKEGMTDADFVLSKVVYDKEADAYYSVNGMYADGYIFGYKQALEVLINYHQSKFDIEHDKIETKVLDEDKMAEKEEGEEPTEDDYVTKVTYKENLKNADEELAKALKALDSDPDWIAYKNSAEYQEVYKKGGKAYSYMISVERIDKLLSALGGNKTTASIVTIVGNAMKSVGEILEKYGLTGNNLKSLSVEKLLSILNDLLSTMSEDSAVVELLAGFGIDANKPITEDVLLDLLANFSYYQYPTLRPKFSFIQDETLRTYAEAQYYAETHGALVGSVLIGDRIGHVTMSTSGYSSEYAYDLTELYTLKAQGELSKYYPFMIMRKYGFICAGIIAVMTVLFYLNKRKEDEMFEIISNGGRR